MMGSRRKYGLSDGGSEFMCMDKGECTLKLRRKRICGWENVNKHPCVRELR